MKKLLFLLAVTTVASLIAVTQNVRAANLNSFYISNYDMQMKLGRDDDGRSTLETTETITAQFSQADINHGLERAIPQGYDGHSVGLKIQSVQNDSGKSLEYSTSDDGDNLIMRIGNPDSYVHGEQTYVIRYTQRDVTRFFENTKKDEFYWDTNGTQWKVPIQKLNIRLTVDESLRTQMTNDNACYKGGQGKSTRCVLGQEDGIYTANALGLYAGENVTVALGFRPGTFEPYQQSLVEKLISIWIGIQVATFIAAMAIGIWLIARFARIINRSKELKPIPPEYIPPAGTSVTTSSKLAKDVTGSVMSAQLLDLAVRHYIKLYESKQKTIFKPAEYEIEVVKDLSGLLSEEQELLSDMFGRLPAISARMNLKDLRNNTSYFLRTTDNDKKLTELIRGTYGLRSMDDSTKQWFKRSALVIMVIAILTLSIPLLVISALTLGLALSTYRLTDKGLKLRRYLEGLKMYIGVAETERLKMLQSPEGAKALSGTKGSTQEKSLIKLYERVLPYAVLFNQDKEWTKSLGRYYETTGQQPDWYTGHGAFNAALFATSIGSLTQAANYTSSSSSSSGGSSGGGFSGGGGGGGGGGGW